MGCRGSEVRILSPRPNSSSRIRASREVCRPSLTAATSPLAHTRPMATTSRSPQHLPAALEGPESDAPFRRLVEGVLDYAIFMLDPEGHVVTWNEGAQRIKGYTAAD